MLTSNQDILKKTQSKIRKICWVPYFKIKKNNSVIKRFSIHLQQSWEAQKLQREKSYWKSWFGYAIGIKLFLVKNETASKN